MESVLRWLTKLNASALFKLSKSITLAARSSFRRFYYSNLSEYLQSIHNYIGITRSSLSKCNSFSWWFTTHKWALKSLKFGRDNFYTQHFPLNKHSHVLKIDIRGQPKFGNSCRNSPLGRIPNFEDYNERFQKKLLLITAYQYDAVCRPRKSRYGTFIEC